MIDVKNFHNTYQLSTHILIFDFDAFMKDKTRYNSRYSVQEHLLISDSPSELTSVLNSHPSGTIQKKDKIYFSSESNFPALLLSRLVNQYNVDVTRTITENKATKFIFNKNPIIQYDNHYAYSSFHEIHLTGCISGKRILCRIPNITDLSRLTYIKSNLEKIWGCSFYYAIPVRNGESAKLYIDHMKEAVDTRVLTKYITSFIPEATDQEIDTVFGFLKSSDKSIRDTGISLFTTMNVSKKLYEVIKKACELRVNNSWAVPTQNSCNSSWKYFLQYIDCDLDELCNNFDRNQSFFLRKILQNPIFDGNMEDIKKEIKIQLLKRLSVGDEFKTLREDLKLINCEIAIHDKNGETTSGN